MSLVVQPDTAVRIRPSRLLGSRPPPVPEARARGTCPRHVPEARLLSRAPEPRPVIVRPSVAVPVDDLRPTTGVAGALVTRRPTSDASPAPAALRCPEGEPLVLRREVVGPCLSRRVALMSIP